MAICGTDVVKRVAKYLDTSPGAVSLTSDKMVTSVFGKETLTGFATVLLHIARQSKALKQTNAQTCLDYQWLEYASVYADHAVTNPVFARKFLQEINSALEYNSYLTGQHLSVSDLALCLTLARLIDSLSYTERDDLVALCRWSRHVNALVRTKN